MEELAKILKRWPQLYHLSDEVYEHITFEKAHLSANLFEALHEKTVVVSSFGKSFHITGWKVGYVVAPEILMNEIKKVHQYLVFTVNSVSQHALAAYLKNENVKALGSFYQKKRDLFRDGLSKSRFDLLPCEGTYFQLASFKKISTLNDVDFCQELVTKHKVAAIPVSVFCDHEDKNHVVRFCFAKEDKTLINATKVLCKI
jgi:methionine aminotransferase